MDKRNLFSIGDVSKMFHLSVGSLRYYEAQGLLAPEYVDPETNYRYYSTRQFEVLNTICYLRALDMPLSQIAAFFKNRDVEVMEEMLLKQRDEVVRKQRELAIVEKKINNRLQQLQDARNSELDVIRLQQIPGCRMVRMEGKLQIQNFLDMETPIRKLHADESEAVIFLGKVGIGISRENLNSFRYDNYDCIFLVLDEEDVYHGQTEQMPACRCVSIRFCGSHREAPAQYEKLMAYIRENHLQVAGFSREITMIDFGFTDDTEQFVTQIQIPVTPLLSAMRS